MSMFCRCQMPMHYPHRPTPAASDLSLAEASTVARFDAAPDAEESLRELLAAAMYELMEASQYAEWPDAHPADVSFCKALGDAAIAVLRGEA